MGGQVGTPFSTIGLGSRTGCGRSYAARSKNGRPSGCGKSTILRLVAGLLTPDKGTLTIQGTLPRNLWGRILYLPQFPQLYSGSIMENLRILSGGASRDRILDVARETGLQELAESLPMGYDAVLPSGGRSLSGGQRQLIALTGALATTRGLLLLDEATANLDPVASQRIARLLAESPCTIIESRHLSTPLGSSR